MKKRTLIPPLKIASLYITISVVWIYTTDNFLNRFTSSLNLYSSFQTYKGWFFVLMTGVLLFYLLYRELARYEKVQAELRRNLEEKTVLINEIHHRVKNNLNTIISFIKLQMMHLEPESRKELQKAADRVYVFSLVLNRISSKERTDKVDLSALITEIVSSIQESFPEARSVMFYNEVPPVYLSINSTILCGIILNELYSNSLRHAFAKSSQTPSITVRMQVTDNIAVLTYSDNGSGFLRDKVEASGTGLAIIEFIVAQLGGTLQFKETKGTELSITFTENIS